MTTSTHGGRRAGAGRPTGSGRIDSTEPLTQLRIPVADKSAVIDLVCHRQALRREREAKSVQELAVRYPEQVMLPDPAAVPLSIPLFASGVRAGFPSPADDYVENTLDLNTYLIQDQAGTFFARVEGDSMIGAGLFDGDVIVVDRGRTPVQGDIVVAVIDSEFTVKRLHRQGSTITLLPENPKYPPIQPTYEQDFMIWGVVTGSVRKF